MMMRIYAIILLCFFVVVPNVYAAPAGNLGDKEKEFGKTFLPLAKDFGMTEYVYAIKSSPASNLYEYLPKGQSLDGWKDMATMTILKLGEKADQALPQIAKSFQSSAAGKKVLDTKTHGNQENSVSYAEYKIGTGSIAEHNLAMIWQVLPGTVAIFQVQKRQEEQSDAIKSKFIKLVNDTANKN